MPISFATLNLQNLQLAGEPTYPNAKPLTARQFNDKINWLAGQINHVDADVIGFQELWHRDALEAVFCHPTLDRSEWTLVIEGTTGRISNALAVRKPHTVAHSMFRRDFPADVSLNSRDQEIRVAVKNFGRPVLRARVLPAPEGRRSPAEIVVMVAHLKSKRPSDVDFARNQSPNPPDKIAMGEAISQIRRAAEAAALRVMISDALKLKDHKQPVVVIGDLNDSQFAVTTDMLGASARYRLKGTSRTGRSSKWGMYAIATLQELRSLRDVYYTYIHEGFRDSLDHILVSQHFYDFSTNRQWAFEEARLFNDHIEDKNTPARKRMISDHGQVKAEFTYKPA